MVGGDVGSGFKVGDGAADAQDAVISTSRKSEAVHGLLHDGAALVGEHAVLACELAAHLGVAMHAQVGGETGRLYGAGGDDTLPYRSAALGFLLTVELAHGHGCHLDVDVIPKMEKEGYER